MSLAMIPILLSTLCLAAPQTLHDFGRDDATNFRCVNDTVMGGRSKSKLETQDDGVLRFSGDLSLENDGGFTSFQARGVDYEIGESDGLEIRVRGDGRTYIFSLDLQGVPIPAGGYWQEFRTENDRWQQIQLPWSKFAPTSFGRTLKGLPEVRPERVSGLAVYLYDKKEGAFRVDFDWIRTYRAEDQTTRSNADTIATPATENSDLLPANCSTLATLLSKTGLDATVAKLDGFTLFAPTDDAFQKLPESVVARLLEPENAAALRKVLLHHVVDQKVTAWNAAGLNRAEVLDGGELAIERRDRDLIIGGARVVEPDRLRGNGVVHVIDSVLVPDDLVLAEPMSPALRVLGSAIERGVPLFNAGEVEACAAVYRTAVEAVVAFAPEDLAGDRIAALRNALEVSRDQDGRTASWTLRRAIDAVQHASL